MSAFPVQKPIIVTRPKPQLRVEEGAKPAVASQALARAACFGVLTLSVLLSSSLAGNVMLEKARRDNLRAVSRAKEATKEEAVLREKVQSMMRSSAIDRWALQNNFVAPETDALSAEIAH
jgi:hypothetical protein